MNLKYYLNKAKREKWAIGQFNFSTLEQLRGILAAAKKLKSPIILGTSEGELGYLGLAETVALVEISKVKYGIPAFLNLDHGNNISLVKKCIDFGYSAVHFDGSNISLKKNIKYVKKITEKAHKKEILVEGEIDGIGKGLTNPEEATKFESETNIDSLAIAIGNRHGYHKKVKLNFKKLKEIKKNNGAFLVLHGGSGISNSQIKEAIKEGIVKVNVNTELRMAWKEALKKEISGKEIKPYKILPKIEKRVQKKVEEKIRVFSSINKI